MLISVTTTTADPRSRRRTANHAALATTTLALASEHGLDGFTVDDVAREAGISRRTFFNHFASKEEAVVEVARLHVHRVLAQVSPTEANEPVARVLDRCVRAMLDTETVDAVRALIALARQHPTLGPYLAAVHDEALERVSESTSDCDPGADVPPVHRYAYPGAVMAAVGAVFQHRLHVVEVDGPPAPGETRPVLTIAEFIEQLDQLLPTTAR